MVLLLKSHCHRATRWIFVGVAIFACLALQFRALFGQQTFPTHDHEGRIASLDRGYPMMERSPTPVAAPPMNISATSCVLPEKSLSTTTLPTGLVVTLALAPKNKIHRAASRKQLCRNVPNQLQFFVNPQGMDMLLLVNDHSKQWNMQQVGSCILQQLDRTPGINVTNNISANKVWQNLDGTTLQTTEYQIISSLATTKLYFAAETVPYPLYIRQNISKLQERMQGPPGCSARLTYLQGCRWYTREMLHLEILANYDYFVKMDFDIIFRQSPSFHMLADMQAKGAVFAHAAEYYPKGDGSCAFGILNAISDYLKASPNHQVACSQGHPQMERETDLYYANFVIGSVSYFTSYQMLRFANFLSEYPNGFFKYKWGDQIFWPYALGLFLRNFSNHVVDYTDLRCKPDPSCWYSVFDVDRYGPTAAEQCADTARGIFVHSKSLTYAADVLLGNSTPARPSTTTLFHSTYQHCPS